MTTEVPDSDNYRNIDSARHHLMLSNNGDDDVMSKRLNLNDSARKRDL